MSKHNVVELAGREKIRDELTDLIREGACKLIAQGLELEVSELLSALSGRQDEAGRAAVVRNGYQPERDIQTGIGPVRSRVVSAVLPKPYVKSAMIALKGEPALPLRSIASEEMAGLGNLGSLGIYRGWHLQRPAERQRLCALVIHGCRRAWSRSIFWQGGRRPELEVAGFEGTRLNPELARC